MITKTIPSILLAVAVLLPMSARGQEGAPASHADVATQVAGVMTEMMTSMAGIKDVETAKAFAASTEGIKVKMKKLLEAAKALPAPTDDEKKAFEATMDAAQEKMMPAMMAMGMNMQNNPDAEQIGMIIGGVMEDEEMDRVGEELQALYELEDGEAGESNIE